MTRTVWLAFADGEDDEAAKLLTPLRSAGYEVLHRGEVTVGESMISSVNAALQHQMPIVFCATRAALGDQECIGVINAARTGSSPVLVVKMHRQALLTGIGVDHKVADYAQDPDSAIADVLASLADRFRTEDQATAASTVAPSEFLSAIAVGAQPDEEGLVDFVTQLRPGFSDEQATPFDTLRRMGLARGANLTLAGLLIVGKDPQAVLPMACVHCYRYLGVTTGAPTTEPVIARGSAQNQIRVATEFIRTNTRVIESKPHQLPQSYADSEYPMASVREIVANAIAHRDYSLLGRKVHINLFDDRLEISSPGDWVGADFKGGPPVSVDMLAQGSDSRNPLLSQALTALRFLEGQGSGLVKAAQAAREARAPLPSVEVRGGNVLVSIYPDVRLSRVAQAIRSKAKVAAASLTEAINEDAANYHEAYLEPKFHLTGDPSVSLTLRQFLRSASPFSLVAGAPGSGKTALSEFLASQLTGQEAFAIAIPARLVSRAHFDLSAAIADSLSRADGEAYRRHEVDAILRNAPVTVLLDGLDEMSGSREAIELVRVARTATREYEQLRVIALGRDSGTALGLPFEYSIAPLEMVDASQLLDRLTTRMALPRGRADSLLDVLPAPFTPLEVRALVDLASRRVAIGGSRLALLDNVVSMLYARDAHRDGGSSLHGRAERVFIALARFWLDGGVPKEWTFNYEQLREAVAQGIGVGADANIEPAVDVVRTSAFLESRLEGGSAAYSFSRPTFLAYFAAIAVIRSISTLEWQIRTTDLANRGEAEVVALILEDFARRGDFTTHMIDSLLLGANEGLTTAGKSLVLQVLAMGASEGWWPQIPTE